MQANRFVSIVHFLPTNMFCCVYCCRLIVWHIRNYPVDSAKAFFDIITLLISHRQLFKCSYVVNPVQIEFNESLLHLIAYVAKYAVIIKQIRQ